MLTQPFTKLLHASLVVAILGLATATSVAAESDDANLCSCFGKKVSRYVHYDDTKRLHLFNVLRCAECDLYQQLDAAARQKLVNTTPTDDATIGALRAHLRWLERTYPRQIAQLLHGILTRIVHDDGSELQRFDSCFFSQFAAALASPRPRHPADGPLVDCGTPAHALVVDVNDIESILLISVGEGSLAKPAIAVGVLRGGENQPLVFKNLPYEWYDPYLGSLGERTTLGDTNSLPAWDKDTKRLHLYTHDPKVPCYGFSSDFSIARDKLQLETSSWNYGCADTMGSPRLCRVPLFKRIGDFRGSLTEGKDACEQPNAIPRPSAFDRAAGAEQTVE